MDDIAIPLMREGRKEHPRKGEYYFTFPKNLHGMQGNGARFYLKTHDREKAQERLNACVIMAQLSNPNIREF